MSFDQEVIKWLLQGDVAIQFQTYRDLLGQEKPSLRKRIEKEGWGSAYLKARSEDGHWGMGYYRPKWTSTHYTLLDLRNLQIRPDQPLIQESVRNILSLEKMDDGGIHMLGEIRKSDVCINGMVLNFASYFQAPASLLESIVDFLLSVVMPDGGFNCQSNRSGAVHSSLHTTLSVIEGITEYEKSGYTYRLEELLQTKKTSIEFILIHQLYLSDRTGKVIKLAFLSLPYPPRWKYDILKCLDAFQEADIPFDKRMVPALQKLIKKQKPDGKWNLNAHHSGARHFEMEKPGKRSRWNTLRALRVLKKFERDCL
jgi:hypothetical protein